MGFLNEKHGMTMLGKTPEGTCPICAVKHDPEMPHNRDSLTYQYKFYDENGRWPTWNDAMAHCPEALQELWKKALTEKGVNLGEEAKR
ncbi:MAG: hypothetical protein RR162_00085 [Oscillospiraceae bacterium]